MTLKCTLYDNRSSNCQIKSYTKGEEGLTYKSANNNNKFC